MIALAALLALSVSLAGCFDEPHDDRANQHSSQDAPANLILYEIADADGVVQGWMLGTIHALPADTQWRNEAISRVLTTADYLLVEVADLDNRGAISRTFAELAKSPGLPDLAERVPPHLHPALAKLLKRGNLSAAQFSDTETWAAALRLAQVDAPGDPAYGVDRALIRDFADREVHEFEGAAAQLRIFDRLPERAQRDLLAGVISEAARLRDDPDRLRRAWLSGDIAALEQATTTGIMADPELREALLTARNRRWALRLTVHLQQEARPLVAVGAAHLIGPDGLQAMLEAQGFVVTRLD